MRTRFERWVKRHPGWDVQPSGAQGHYRLAQAGRHELYCRDAPTAGYCNAFVERATAEDRADLARFGDGWVRYEPEHNGVRIHLRPEAAEKLANWCDARQRNLGRDYPISRSEDEDERSTLSGSRTVPPISSEGRSRDGLGAALRKLIEPSWPHDHLAFVTRTAPTFASFPPVHFVGDPAQAAPDMTLFVGMNPNIRPNDLPYIREIEGGFNRFWESCGTYFAGPHFNYAHYRVHAAYLAGILGATTPPASVMDAAALLNQSALAVDLCPLSSPSSAGLPDKLLMWRAQKAWVGFEVTDEVVKLVVEHRRPARIVARYGQSALVLRKLYGLRGQPDLITISGVTIPLKVLRNKPNRGGNPTDREAFQRGSLDSRH